MDCDCGIVCGDVCSHVFLCKTDETKPNAERYCEGNSAASRGCQQRQQKRPGIENGSKEAVVTYLRGVMQDAESVDEARIQIQKRLPEIEAVAKEKMQQKGYSYDADATLSSCYFPVKTYGDMIFPAGEYEALKVNLGKSAGKNWWCVMYPTLCFVDSTYQIVPGESKEKLKKCLTEEEYNSLLDGENGIETSSLFIEWIRNILFS